MNENTAGTHLYFDQVAERIGVTVSTLRTMRKVGNAPEPLGKVGTRLVWELTTVDAWIEARAAGRARGICIIDGCTRSGWVARDARCSEHAVIRELFGVDRPGTLPHRPRTQTLARRHASWTILDPDTGCLLWTGSAGSHGYGQIQVGDENLLAHRVAWELVNGEIPAAMTVDHRCNRVRCQNVRHMQLVDRATNTKLMFERLAARKVAGVRASAWDRAREAWLDSSVPVADVLAAAAGALDTTALDAFRSAHDRHAA